MSTRYVIKCKYVIKDLILKPRNNLFSHMLYRKESDATTVAKDIF
jgi:hypothetical protein